jgi:mRNA-degrading endonuclease RelE of RelBE toxin-antitoxin system
MRYKIDWSFKIVDKKKQVSKELQNKLKSKFTEITDKQTREPPL